MKKLSVFLALALGFCLFGAQPAAAQQSWGVFVGPGGFSINMSDGCYNRYPQPYYYQNRGCNGYYNYQPNYNQGYYYNQPSYNYYNQGYYYQNRGYNGYYNYQPYYNPGYYNRGYYQGGCRGHHRGCR